MFSPGLDSHVFYAQARIWKLAAEAVCTVQRIVDRDIPLYYK